MTRYCRNPQVSETSLGEETFLVDAAGREVYYLDAITSGVWRLLAEPQTLESCRAVFAAAFPDVAPERLAADLERALSELTAGGLVLESP